MSGTFLLSQRSFSAINNRNKPFLFTGKGTVFFALYLVPHLPPVNKVRGGGEGFTLQCQPEQFQFHPSPICLLLCSSPSHTTISHGQQVSLHCRYRFWHVLQWVVFFPCSRYRPHLPGVLGNRGRDQDPKDSHVHLVQPEVQEVWL